MNFTMMRDRTVATVLGRSFDFKKGEPLYVPPMCYEAVMAAGAVPEDELPADDPETPPTPFGQARTDLIIEAMKKMIVRGEREDFAASGVPKVEPLVKELGFKLDPKERDVVWALANNDTPK